MLDARNVYRKVTRKIYDFSPEQQQNLLAIVWLYRGETERYLQLVSRYLGKVADEAQACFELKDEAGQTAQPLPDYAEALKVLATNLAPFLNSSGREKTGQRRRRVAEFQELEKETELFDQDIEQFRKTAQKTVHQWEAAPDTNAALVKLTNEFEPMAEASRDLIKQTDLIYKLATRLIDEIENVARMERSGIREGRTKHVARMQRSEIRE